MSVSGVGCFFRKFIIIIKLVSGVGDLVGTFLLFKYVSILPCPTL